MMELLHLIYIHNEHSLNTAACFKKYWGCCVLNKYFTHSWALKACCARVWRWYCQRF